MTLTIGHLVAAGILGAGIVLIIFGLIFCLIFAKLWRRFLNTF